MPPHAASSARLHAPMRINAYRTIVLLANPYRIITLALCEVCVPETPCAAADLGHHCITVSLYCIIASSPCPKPLALQRIWAILYLPWERVPYTQGSHFWAARASAGCYGSECTSKSIKNFRLPAAGPFGGPPLFFGKLYVFLTFDPKNFRRIFQEKVYDGPCAARIGGVTSPHMARRRAPKLKINLAKALKPKKSPLMSALMGRDQRGNPAYSRRYDLMRFPRY